MQHQSQQWEALQQHGLRYSAMFEATLTVYRLKLPTLCMFVCDNEFHLLVKARDEVLDDELRASFAITAATFAHQVVSTIQHPWDVSLHSSWEKIKDVGEKIARMRKDMVFLADCYRTCFTETLSS